MLNLSPSWYRYSHRGDLGFGRAVHENCRVKLVCETAPFTLYLQQLVSRLKESPGLPLIVEFAEPIIGPGDLKVMRQITRQFMSCLKAVQEKHEGVVLAIGVVPAYIGGASLAEYSIAKKWSRKVNECLVAFGILYRIYVIVPEVNSYEISASPLLCTRGEGWRSDPLWCSDGMPTRELRRRLAYQIMRGINWVEKYTLTRDQLNRIQPW